MKILLSCVNTVVSLIGFDLETGAGFWFAPEGFLREEERTFITSDYFLRGALPLEDGSMLLGGSSLRRENGKGMAVLRLMPNGAVHEYPLAPAGEIYDILPWQNRLMRPVVRGHFNPASISG